MKNIYHRENLKTIGFPISTKENENRRTIIPIDISKISYPNQIYVETGYGDVLGIRDEEYISQGCNICSHEESISKDVICDPKIGDASYLEKLDKGKIIFGWIHATQNRNITDILLERELSVYAWEKMFENGKHVFWFNNELAGEAAVLHGFQCYGKLPIGLNVAVIGNGNTARGACKVLNMLGANITQYTRSQETMIKEDIGQFDVIVNCILWDVKRTDHIIYRKDLKKMKRDSMIIDVSCDRNGGIETSIPTSIQNPTYYVEHVLHYVVDHTPAVFYKTFSYNNSKVITPYIEMLINNEINDTLQKSLIIRNGIVIDQEINEFQNR